MSSDPTAKLISRRELLKACPEVATLFGGRNTGAIIHCVEATVSGAKSSWSLLERRYNFIQEL